VSAADAVTQDRVYRALKTEYLAGEFSLGERLELQPAADRLRSSKTPVREAIHRLIGEGLVEADPGGGFRIWRPAPADLAELYGWNHHLLGSPIGYSKPAERVLRLRALKTLQPPARPFEIVQRTSALFLSFAEGIGNGEAMRAVAHLNERLLYVRLSESADVERAARELHGLVEGVEGSTPDLRRRLRAYHQRRVGRERATSQQS